MVFRGAREAEEKEKKREAKKRRRRAAPKSRGQDAEALSRVRKEPKFGPLRVAPIRGPMIRTIGGEKRSLAATPNDTASPLLYGFGAAIG